MVVVSHVSNVTGLWDRMLGEGGGQVGVMLFFVLSGYLIGGLYLDRQFTLAAVRAYAVHRIARVLPLFYVVVTAALLLGIYPIAGVQQALAHYGVILGSSVLWTIPVEMHFYVLFVGLWWLHHRAPRAMVALCIILIAVYWALPIEPAGDVRIFPYYAVFFFSGLLVSRAVSLNQVQPAPWLWELAPLAALPFLMYPNIYRALFGADGWMARGEYQQMWHDPRYAIAATALLLSALLSPPIIWLLSTKPMRFLGAISYSMYLLHHPIIDLLMAHTAWRSSPFTFLATTFVLTIGASTVTFLLIERPARRSLNALAKPAPAASAATT